MPQVEFFGQPARKSDDPQADTARLINCYREPLGDGGHIIRSVLSETEFATVKDSFMRALLAVGDELFVCAGSALSSVSPTGTVRPIAPITDGESDMSLNNGKIAICANGTYRVWAVGTGFIYPATLPSPTIGAFSNYGSVAFLGQYTLVTEQNGRKVTWSAVADPETFDALHFKTKEGRPDNILRGVTVNGRYLILGEQSHEVWYQTGQPGVDAFKRVSGGVFDTGLKAYGLVATFDQGVFFVGDDDVAYISAGENPRPVSNRAVEAAIANGRPTRCFYYEDEGHKFCVIRFADRPAWVLDLATLEWHERSKSAHHRPWDAVASVKFDGQWRVGNDLNTISTLTRGGVDGTTPMRRTMVSRTLAFDGARPTVAELEVFPKRGFAAMSDSLKRVKFLVDENNALVTDESGNYVTSDVTSDDPRDAACYLRLSRDGGATWSKPKTRSMGAYGEYDRRVIWRAQGQCRQLTVELNCTEPADITFKSVGRLRLT